MGLLWIFVIVFLLAPIAGAVAYRIKADTDRRAVEGRTPGPAELRDEVRELDERVSRLSSELDRLSDEQRFLVRLLEERDTGSSGPGSGDGERLGPSDQERTSVS